MRLMLAGCTGLVGRHVLELALADGRITEVVVPVRRPLAPRPRLTAPVVDYEDLPGDADWWAVDAAICTLGTTIRTAGSQDTFRRVDHDYPLMVARLAHRHGAATFALNSAMGADPASRIFYNRVKGEVERDIGSVGFRSLTIVRPGLLGGERSEVRPAERIASVALRFLHPVLPRSLRINEAGTIAAALLEAAIAGRPGVHVVGSAALA